MEAAPELNLFWGFLATHAGENAPTPEIPAVQRTVAGRVENAADSGPDAVGRCGRNPTSPFFPNDIFLSCAFFLIGNVEFVCARDPFSFGIDERAIDAPPLADTFLHDVVFNGGEPARVWVGQ